MSVAVLEAPTPAVVPPPAPSVALPAAEANAPGDLLELPEVRARVWRMPVEVCERLIEQGLVPENSELIEGVIIEKMSKSPLHGELIRWLCERFRDLVPVGCIVRQEGPLRLASSLPEPDVSVVRGDAQSLRRTHPTTAELVVEIAVSTLAADRKMASLYVAAEVPECWIVLGPEEAVEVYRRPENGVYQDVRRVGRGETLACGQVPELRVAMDELFG